MQEEKVIVKHRGNRGGTYCGKCGNHIAWFCHSVAQFLCWSCIIPMLEHDEDYGEIPPKCDICKEYDMAYTYTYCVEHRHYHCPGCWDDTECRREE